MKVLDKIATGLNVYFPGAYSSAKIAWEERAAHIYLQKHAQLWLELMDYKSTSNYLVEAQLHIDMHRWELNNLISFRPSAPGILVHVPENDTGTDYFINKRGKKQTEDILAMLATIREAVQGCFQPTQWDMRGHASQCQSCPNELECLVQGPLSKLFDGCRHCNMTMAGASPDAIDWATKHGLPVVVRHSNLLCASCKEEIP